MSLVLFLFSLTSLKAADHVVHPSDIDHLVGGYWIGKLTYLDYTSGDQTSIRTGLRVEKIDGAKSAWRFHRQYPDEPHANSSTKVCLKANGRKLNGETVLRREVLENGHIEIVTTKKKGKLVFRYTYLISDEAFSIRKEEAPAGSDQYLERNRFVYEKEMPVK